MVLEGDVITSTIRPIRRLTALIQSGQDGHACSSGFVVLNPTHIAAEVLLVYLRLPIFCELMDLYTSASLYPAVSEYDLLTLPIPSIAEDIQKSITESVQQSFAQSEHMLNVAKRAVEIAIETDEKTAMAPATGFDPCGIIQSPLGLDAILNCTFFACHRALIYTVILEPNPPTSQ